jgi:hypothetical protein
MEKTSCEFYVSDAKTADFVNRGTDVEQNFYARHDLDLLGEFIRFYI